MDLQKGTQEKAKGGQLPDKEDRLSGQGSLLRNNKHQAPARVEAGPVQEREQKKLHSLYTKQFFKNNHLCFGLALISNVALFLSNLFLSFLLKEVTDLIAGVEGGSSFPSLIIQTLLLVLYMLAVHAIHYFTFPRFMQRAMTQYKNFVFDKLARKSIASFKQESRSLYLSALSNDATVIEENYLNGTIKLVQQIVIFCGALTMMLLLNVRLTVATIFLSILPILASLLTGNRLAPIEKTVSDKNGSFIESLKDTLTGFSVMKSFKAEWEMAKLFQNRTEGLEEAKYKKRKLTLVINVIASLAGFATQMGVFLYGAWLAVSGDAITAGTIIAFVQLMNFIIQPIGTVPGLLAQRKAASGLISKLAAALEEHVQDEGEELEGPLQEGIRLDHLSFSYVPGERALDDLNFRFEQGKSYALVGASGSGKSTLLNTLMAASRDYEGQILYDRQELRQISSESLYDLLSLIQQDVFIFNASIRDNITMFRDFPQEEIDRVIALSGLGPVIAEKGQDSLCGENGSKLSGGEKQRISIARSLLRHSSILLVDEATAALDPQTARQVSQSLLDLQGITRIVVTHSLEADLLASYDEILVMKNGRIIESGDFESLMAAKDYFYSLCKVTE